MKKILIFMAIPVLVSFNFPDKNLKNKYSENMSIKTVIIEKIVSTLTEKYGLLYKEKIEKGVKQAYAFWTEADGDENVFENFCYDNYAKPGEEQKVLFDRFSTNLEILIGHFNKISLDLKSPLHLDKGDMINVDEAFSSYDVSAHLSDDFFKNKIAFAIILNFPFYSLKEKEILGTKWTREEWAYAKLGDVFTSRTPQEILQKSADALTASETYISQYNIYMGWLVDEKMVSPFPVNLKLITHWGLRDELKSNYAVEDGLTKQMMIYEVMKKIITQEIPTEVINKRDYLWNPYTNMLFKPSKEKKLKDKLKDSLKGSSEKTLKLH